MRILHTADWHLGRTLYGRKRYQEFSDFLSWLLDRIVSEKIDVLLIAGDIFDTSTPSNKAQELYYSFLCQMAQTCCRHIVVIGGNHDSPSFLNAPAELLRVMNVHVVGAATPEIKDEVLTLRGADGVPEAIVCAVPYLRDRDIRTASAGETIDDKNRKLIEGVRSHYAQVCAIALNLRDELENSGAGKIPIIGMGHLFAAGGSTVEGDGVRELYVGSLAHVGRDVFPTCLDYLALGHLHVPQLLGGEETLRYSGSPVPMGFGEAQQVKQVVLVEFRDMVPQITPLEIPCFQKLVRIKGSLEAITIWINELRAQGSSAWLEVEYSAEEQVGDLRDRIQECVEGSELELLRIKNSRVIDRLMQSTVEHESLDELGPAEVFSRCLDSYNVDPERRGELTARYSEVLQELLDEDSAAQ